MRKIIHNILNPTNIPNCKFWWEGDFTPKQGNSIVVSGNNYVYDSIPNRGSLGGGFSGTDALRPVVTYLDSSGFPRRVPYFLDGYQESSLDAGDWEFLHYESTIVFVTFCADTSTIFSTFDNDANNIGIDITLRREANGGDILLRVGNGSGTHPINDGSSITEFTDNILHVSSIRIAQAGYDIRIDGVTVLEDVPVDTLSGSDPQDTLNIGRRSNDTQPFTGNLIAAVAYDGYLALEQLGQVEAHFISKYSHQSVPVLQKPTFYFNFNLMPYAYHIDVNNGEAGLQADRLVDFSGNGHDAIQTTDSKQGTLGADADGNTEVSVDGTADCYTLSAGAGWPAGTSHTFLTEVDQDDASGTNDLLLQSTSQALVIGALSATAGKIGFYDTGWHNIADAATGEQSLEICLDGVGGTGYAYRNGVYLGETTYAAPHTFGGTVSLLANYNLTSGFYDGAVQELWGRNSLQSVAEQFASRQYRANRYPTRWASTLPLVVPVATSPTAGAWFDTRAEANFVNEAAVADALTNGDFETGSPPSNWTAGGGATLTAQPGARTGGSGSQVLRVEAPGGDAQTWAAQNTVVNGSTYHVTGWAKGDGTNGYPRLVVNGVVWWNGTTSTDWQYFDVVNTTTGIVFSLTCQGNTGTTDYAYFDDVECILCPPVIVAKDCSRDVDDPVSNGDFEIGHPAAPTGWNAFSGAILTSQSGARTGGTGSWVLQNVCPAADNATIARQQSILTVGCRYLVDVWAKGDDVNGWPRLEDPVTGGFLSGTTSSTWQHLIAVWTTSSADLWLVARGDLASDDTTQWDDLVITPGNHGYQATSANRPTYDAVNKCLTFVAASSEWLGSGIVAGSAGSFSCWVKPTGGTYIWGARSGATARCYIEATGGNWVITIGANFKIATGTVTGDWQYIVGTWDGSTATIYVDTVAYSVAYTGTPSTHELYYGARNETGVSNGHLSGSMSHPITRNYAMTAAMVAQQYALGRT